MSPAPKDYVDVAERIRQFKAKFPDGSLQNIGEPHMMSAGDKAYIVYCAAAYRTPDDERPGIGWAWEPVPGPTPFTRDSELMNAETSAWGRAIVALGFDTKHVASSNEVQNREQFVPPSGGDIAATPPPEEPPVAAERPRAASERPAARETLRILKETVETLQKGFPSPDPTHSYWDDVRAYMIGEFAKSNSAELTEAQVQELILHMEKRLVEAQRQTEIPLANWEPDEMLGQNMVDVQNEARRSSHYEISPREREDGLERDRRDFDPEPEEQPIWFEIRIVDDED